MTKSLPSMDLSDNPTGCCPRFVSGPWDHQEFSLEGLSFIKASTRSFFFMPLNMSKVMTKTQRDIEAAGAKPQDRYFMLSQDISPWKAVHYFLVTREVPGYQLVTLPGTYYSRVFEGPYQQMGSWYKTMKEELAAKSLPMKDVFAFYTTCPQCAKVYGKNEVVLLARSA